MKHIQLLTMESYLEAKQELVENLNCTFDKLQIDRVEEVSKIMEEIKKVYFEEEKECELQNPVPIKVWKEDSSIVVNATRDVGRKVFFKSLKSRYCRLIKEKRNEEIVEEIKRVLCNEFINSCKVPSGQMKRVYEIIKYTLTKERLCYWWDNGNFISEMEKEDIYPFEIINEKLPIYCQNMQCILFGVHRKIFVNPNSRKYSLDITRFSFYNVKKIIDAVTEALMTDKENNKNYDVSYIEGVEDYILLDEILGISLTNIVYWKTKEIKGREIQDDIIEIVPYLAKCRYSTGRDSVAQVLLDYLEMVDYNKNIIREVGKMLKKEVQVWNEYYEKVEAVVLCPIFRYLEECSENDLIKVCKDMEENNAWDEYIYMDEIVEDNKKKEDENTKNDENKEDIWDEYIYMDEIVEGDKKKEDENTEDNKKKKEDKIRIPKGDMNNRTWYAYIHKTVFDAIWS